MTEAVHEKTYEMLWDCAYCGRKKNLGVTHRHCPSCGAPQDATRRYFPSEGEKIAVEDHPYVGADLVCPACSKAQSRAASCCGNCGSPLAAGRDVGLVAAPAPPPAPKSFPWALVVLGSLVALVAAFFIVRALWKSEVSVTVASHGWTREIEIERNDAVSKSGACAKVPAGAEVTSRKMGEPVCTTKKLDQGDGTFKEKKECTNAEEQCEYRVREWKTARTLKETGSAAQPPKWPEVKLGRTGSCEGCEREGKRSERYAVHFKEAGGGTSECSDPSPDKWSALKVGEAVRAKKNVVGGDLDCDSVAPAK